MANSDGKRPLVNFRMAREEIERLDAAAKARNMDRSALIREALRPHLEPETAA